MKMREWFNPYDINHLKAYMKLTTTGTWPKNFVPEDLDMNNWYIEIQLLMAEAWLRFKLGEELKPEPFYKVERTTPKCGSNCSCNMYKHEDDR